MPTSSGFGFGLKKIQQLQEAFQLADRIRTEALKLQGFLKATTIKANYKEEIVIVYNAMQEPIKCEIQPQALSNYSVEELNELIFKTMLDAYHAGRESIAERFKKILIPLKADIDKFQKQKTLGK